MITEKPKQTHVESLQTKSHRMVSSKEVPPFVFPIFNIWIKLDTKETQRQRDERTDVCLGFPHTNTAKTHNTL